MPRVKGAQCVAMVIYWMRHMRVIKTDVEKRVAKYFGYEIPPLKDIMKIGSEGHFDSICQETVPWALRCFLDANSFEETIRLAVLCDGDTDTKAAIAGSIAEAYYGVPDSIVDQAIEYLPDEMLTVLDRFYDRLNEQM